MIYRCVKANNSNEVLAIGYDENQGGKDYWGLGVWENWTFTVIPEVPSNIVDYALSINYTGSLVKVFNNTLILKTIDEIV